MKRRWFALMWAVLLIAVIQSRFGLPRTVIPMFVLLVIALILLVFGGVDWFRGGRHLDLSRIEHGPILGRGDEPDEG